MRLLQTEPAGTLKSLEELFALAHAMENEAAQRYAGFAGLMRKQGQENVATVFDRIAAEERGHLDSVTAWSEARAGQRPDPAALRWQGPATFEEEDTAEIAGSRLMTPYRVLTIAVRNEERAFAFWSYVAAHADREEVRLAAETMAKEELEHVAAFRRERRKAYHDAKASGSHVSEQIEACRLEERLASRLNEIGLEHPAVADRIRTLVDQTRAMAGRARELSIRGRVSGDGSAEALGESLAEIYLQAADASRDERALPLIQELAEGAVVRLSKLRSFPLRG